MSFGMRRLSVRACTCKEKHAPLSLKIPTFSQAHIFTSLLLAARSSRAAQMDPRTHPATAETIQTLFPAACKRCEASLSRAGNAQSQSLYECYARLQQLRGAPVSFRSPFCAVCNCVVWL
jgi:hypothetical protein